MAERKRADKAQEAEQEQQQEEEDVQEIQVLDLDALDTKRQRVKIGGKQYEVKRQADLSDRDGTRLTALDNQVSQLETLEERQPLNVERMQLMLYDQPPVEVLEALPEGKVRQLGLFFIRIWNRELNAAIQTIKVNQQGDILD